MMLQSPLFSLLSPAFRKSEKFKVKGEQAPVDQPSVGAHFRSVPTFGQCPVDYLEQQA
jgi:hypothetical protein